MLVVLAATLPGIVGCVGGVEVDRTFLSEKRYEPRPPDHPIEFYLGAPSRPYVAIGHVVAREDGNYEHPASGQKSIDQVKAIVRQMGGDAVIDFQMISVMLRGNMGLPTKTRNSDGSVTTTYRYSVNEGDMTTQGMVIRWE